MTAPAPSRSAHLTVSTGSIRTVVLVVIVALVAVVAGERLVHALRVPPADRAIGVLRVVAAVRPAHRGQRPSDLVGAPPAADFVRSSVRRLAVVPETATVVSSAVDRRGNICLVATDPLSPGYRAACATAPTVAATGLRLVWSADVLPHLGSGADARSFLPRLVIADLGPDGRLRLDSQLPTTDGAAPYPVRPAFGALGITGTEGVL